MCLGSTKLCTTTRRDACSSAANQPGSDMDSMANRRGHHEVPKECIRIGASLHGVFPSLP